MTSLSRRWVSPRACGVAAATGRAHPVFDCVMQVDATENKAAAQAFGVKGYPTVVLAKDGKKFEYSGKRTLDALSEFAKVGMRAYVSPPHHVRPMG